MYWLNTRIKYTLLLSIAIMMVSGCSKNKIAQHQISQEIRPNINQDSADIFAIYDAKELIDGIKLGHIDAKGYTLSATDRELFVYGTSQAVLKVMPMPASFFYLAVAPYLQRTHSCSTHSVTGCRGELQNADVTVRLYNQRGKLLLDKQYNTGSNGFIDLWLPRDLKDAKLKIFYLGKKASKTIATVSGAKTCETTMQLLDA